MGHINPTKAFTVGDAEFWQAYYVFSGRLDKRTLRQWSELNGIEQEYCGGPGQSFSRSPYFRIGAFHSIVEQTGGLDI